MKYKYFYWKEWLVIVAILTFFSVKMMTVSTDIDRCIPVSSSERIFTKTTEYSCGFYSIVDSDFHTMKKTITQFK